MRRLIWPSRFPNITETNGEFPIGKIAMALNQVTRIPSTSERPEEERHCMRAAAIREKDVMKPARIPSLE
jgi:hypothetical protein